MTAYLKQSKLYKFHVENLRSIEIALSNAAISARKSISQKNNPATQSFIRLYAFLLGAWAETRLHKLINESGAFSDEEKTKIFSQGTHLDQWIKIVEVSFRKYYKITKSDLNEKTLPHSAFHKLNTIRDILDGDLRLIIEVRNKLAHGQWVYPLNSSCTDVESNKYALINKENIMSLQFKRALLSTVADIIHDLVVSIPTFHRDFDSHYKNIVNIRNNLSCRTYTDYQHALIEKRKRGIKKRRDNNKKEE